MTAHLNRLWFTVADYYKMAETGILSQDQRYELLNGEIIKTSPQKSPHTTITHIIFEKFLFQLKNWAEGRAQAPLNINNHSEPEPDIMVLKKRESRYLDRHPVPKEVYLVVEVSDSTLNKDQTFKKKLYAKAGIPEYWIINIPEKQIEIYTNPKDEDYLNVTISKSGKVAFEKLEKEVVISVEKLF